jgi:hypothetical protein
VLLHWRIPVGFYSNDQIGDNLMVRGQDSRLDAATLSIQDLYMASVVRTLKYGLMLSWRRNMRDLLVGQN